jgi:hypothetical protein
MRKGLQGNASIIVIAVPSTLLKRTIGGTVLADTGQARQLEDQQEH